MAAQISDLLQPIHNFQHYTLAIEQATDVLVLTLVIKNDMVNTKSLPHVQAVLQRELPTIFSHRCFNYAQRSFKEEAVQTAVGHLFEHILLEYLLQAKQQTQRMVKVSGETSWNWEKDERGTYTIAITHGITPPQQLLQSLVQTIHLFNRLLTPTVPVTLPREFMQSKLQPAV